MPKLFVLNCRGVNIGIYAACGFFIPKNIQLKAIKKKFIAVSFSALGNIPIAGKVSFFNYIDLTTYIH